MAGAHAWVGGYRLPLATLVAVAASAALAVLAGARPAALILAGILAVAAVVRATSRTPGAGIAIRSRWFDVGFLASLALVIALFAATTSGV